MSASALHALAAGLCADRGLRVLVGRTWSYDPQNHTIQVPKGELDRRGAIDCAGIVAHEVGHAWLSRYAAFSVTGACRTATLLALNAFEDGRVERWMTARYPGVARWLELAHGQFEWRPMSPLWDFLLLAAYEASLDFRPQPARGASRLAVLALASTREARREYVERFLPDNHLTPPDDVYERYDAEVAPRDRGADPPTPEEAWVRVSALRALVHAEEALLPWVERLLEDEVRTVARALEDEAFRALAAHRSGVGVRGLREAYRLRGALDAPGGSPHEPRARHLVYAIYARVAHECARGHGGFRGSIPGLSTTSRDEDPSYAEVLRDTRAIRSALRAAIAPALPPAERARSHGASTHGRQLSLRHAFAADALRHRATAVFEHPSAPRRPRAAFSLLIDLSGSMRGDKIASAIRALVAVAEVLDELGVPFAIHGFQDAVIPVLAHGWRLDDAARETLVALPLEVQGSRSGGHNEPGYNDDGPCVREAAEALANVDAEDRWLLVLSDGHPEGSHSTRDDLHAAVKAIARLRPLVHVIGLGIGAGTKHVAEYYPRHVAEIPIAELPARLGAVVRGCVGG